jgi:UDPglucose 6-dehydrogenase
LHNEKIGILGLGKLGLPMLTAFISRGFDVIGYDTNEELISVLRSKKNPYQEPGINEILSLDDKWVDRFYSDFSNFICKIDICFLIVPTPTKDEIFDISILRLALENINKVACNLGKRLICVVTSTVNPGDCDDLLKQLDDEDKSTISLVYSPEFIALGSVLRDMLNPDVVLLGSDDMEAADKVFSIYSRLYKTYPEFHRLSFVEAETAKIAINSYVTTKISFANTIGLYVESITGSRQAAQKVLNAVGGDSRIGRKYFKYGVSYGGPCFPRDNRALTAHLNKMGVCADLPIAADLANNFMLQYWLQRIDNKKYDALVIVGLAYKAGTDFLDESFMIKLGKALANKIPIFFCDELINVSMNFIKLTPETHLKHLSQYQNIIVMQNYGDFNFDKKLDQITMVDIWN